MLVATIRACQCVCMIDKCCEAFGSVCDLLQRSRLMLKFLFYSPLLLYPENAAHRCFSKLHTAVYTTRRCYSLILSTDLTCHLVFPRLTYFVFNEGNQTQFSTSVAILIRIDLAPLDGCQLHLLSPNFWCLRQYWSSLFGATAIQRWCCRGVRLGGGSTRETRTAPGLLGLLALVREVESERRKFLQAVVLKDGITLPLPRRAGCGWKAMCRGTKP